MFHPASRMTGFCHIDLNEFQSSNNRLEHRCWKLREPLGFN